MTREEHETLITINDADARDGFFVFYTTKPNQFARLCKRIGGQDNLRSMSVDKSGGAAVAWSCEVPIEFLSKNTFAIGKRRKAPELSEEKQLERNARLRAGANRG